MDTYKILWMLYAGNPPKLVNHYEQNYPATYVIVPHKEEEIMVSEKIYIIKEVTSGYELNVDINKMTLKVRIKALLKEDNAEWKQGDWGIEILDMKHF